MVALYFLFLGAIVIFSNDVKGFENSESLRAAEEKTRTRVQSSRGCQQKYGLAY
jgi:hypothetical protein